MVVDLLAKYKAHAKHAKQVQKLALLLFDKTKELGLHNMSDRKREKLAMAALLHDIGYFVGAKGHNKNSADLIMQENFDGMDNDDKAMIAAIARYHRGSLPNKRHALYCDFSPKKQKTLQKLAGILRLCDGLDRSHLCLVSDLELKYDEEDDILWCYVVRQNPDVTVDLASARRKKDLFEKGFEIQFVLVLR